MGKFFLISILPALLSKNFPKIGRFLWTINKKDINIWSMFKKELQALQHLKKSLRGTIGNELITLAAFGSRVRGDFRWDSDLDILIIVNKSSLKKEKVIREIVYSEGERLNILYSVIIRGKEEFDMEKRHKTPFYTAVMREGMILYERRS